MWRINDPAKTLERIQARMQEAEEMIAYYEATDFPALAAVYRRRLRSLKGAHTRVVRMLT